MIDGTPWLILGLTEAGIDDVAARAKQAAERLTGRVEAMP